MYSYRKLEEKAKQPSTSKLLKERRKEIQILPFYGEFDPDTYLKWEKDMDFVFHCHRCTAEKQVQLATTGLCGYALDWWFQTANTRRQYGEQQISSWYEMKAVMKKRFVAKRYGQTDLERMQIQAKEAKGRVRTSIGEPKSYYVHEEQRKFQLHEAYLDELQNPQFKEHLRNMIDQSLNAVMKDPQQRSVPRPAAREDELSCYQKEPAEMKEETAAKHGEKEPETESEPTSPCQGDYFSNHHKQEEISSVMCDHVPGKNQAEEGVLGGSPKAHELALTTMVEEGDIIESFSCNLLTNPPVWIQTSIVDHLRFVKGLQHLVFEPGGSFCVHISINNTLIQIATAVKLDLEGFLHEQEEPMLVSGESKLRTRAEESSINECVWYQWGEAQSEAIRSKLNKEQKLLALSVACNEHSLVEPLGRVKVLQGFVFEPGGDIKVHKGFNNTLVQRETKKLRLDSLFILEELDLRTNPFKGGGNGATWISFKLMLWKPMDVTGRKWAIAQPNGPIGELIGLIHEVLDRQKAMGLEEALIKMGMTMDQHGRLVCNLIDQEMDGRKLVGQEMKWVIWYDQEMDCSNRHGQEMSWKWKMKNQSWKWNISRIFLIQMSIRSNLVGPGTRWIEPKQELFQKGLYRPKKWKDKPAWFMIGPRRLGTTIMVYFKCIWFN